jgi:hypothetical protein
MMRSSPWVRPCLTAVLALGPAVAGLAPAAAASRGGYPVAAQAPGAAWTAAPGVTDAVPVGSKRGLPAPRLTPAMARANAVRQAQALAFLQARWARRHPGGGKCTLMQCLKEMPAARDMAATQQPQLRNYYCGPATVSAMLAQLRVRLGQRAAARQLGTSGSGTDWSNKAGYPVPRVLNRHQRLNRYVAVGLPWTPTAGQVAVFEADLVADLNHNGGVPLGVNAYEVPGGPHLVGHPAGQTIMHWVDIRGYASSGTVTDYQDSVHGASSIGWAAAVPAYSSLPSATIVNISGARGYVW